MPKLEILGIDTSQHQDRQPGEPPWFGIDREDWLKVAELGPLSFAFNRLSRGAGYIDPTAKTYLRWADDAGIVTGGYHFFEPDEDGLAQARMANAAIAGLAVDGIRLDAFALDVESVGTRYREVCEFLAAFRCWMPGQTVGLYTRLGYLAAKRDPEFRAIARLFDWTWLADYTSADGKASRPLSNGRWRTPTEDEGIRPGPLWQTGALIFTDPDDVKPDGKRHMDSIDCNVFTGTQRDLLAYVGR